MSVRALGTIVEYPHRELSDAEIYCGVLDYYDHWSSVDPRLTEVHARLSRSADAVGHDLVNMATYVHEILDRFAPARIADPSSVVTVGGMTEAFLVSLRAAADAVGSILSYRVSPKAGQAPSDLRPLIRWASGNPDRVHPAFRTLLAEDFGWFWNLRSLRDHIVHGDAHANIHCDGSQFNLWIHSPKVGWVTREPLLPLLRDKLRSLLSFADRTAAAVNGVIGFPSDRVRSRVVCGVFVPSLHRLDSIAGEYARPSP